jgi:hypothetical protein
MLFFSTFIVNLNRTFQKRSVLLKAGVVGDEMMQHGNPQWRLLR